MKKPIYSLEICKEGERIRYYGHFYSIEEVLKLGKLVLRTCVFSWLTEKEQILQAIEEWNKSGYVKLRGNAWMRVDKSYVYDAMEDMIRVE